MLSNHILKKNASKEFWMKVKNIVTGFQIRKILRTFWNILSGPKKVYFFLTDV